MAKTLPPNVSQILLSRKKYYLLAFATPGPPKNFTVRYLLFLVVFITMWANKRENVGKRKYFSGL